MTGAGADVAATSPRTESPSYRPVVLGTIASVATAVAYLPGLGRSLGYDAAETVGFFVLTPSPSDALTAQRSFNNHPLFSFLENLIVRAAGHSDEWLLRLLPIACAALAVGILVAAVARGFGAIPAVTAGLVLATNPMFVEIGRAVRGYSLMVLVAIASTVLHLRLMRSEAGTSRVGYTIVAVTGLMNHLSIAPVFLAHATDTLRRGRINRGWLAMWAGTGALTLVFYARMLDDLVGAGESRGRIFRAGFPLDLLRAVLGQQLPAVLILALLGCYGAHRLRHHRSLPAFAGVAVVTAAVMWVAAPENLAPRFFVWLVPAVAVLVARATADRPVLAPIAGLAAAVSAASFLPTYADSVNRYPDVAAIIDREAASGRTVCVTDLSVPPMIAYTREFEAITDPDDAAGCDVVAIAEPVLDSEYATRLATAFPHRIDLDARDPAIIFSRVPIDLP